MSSINNSINSTVPQLNVIGSSSGTVSIIPQAAAGTYNFNLPITSGTSGYLLTSAGGGSSAMTWSASANASSFIAYSSVDLTDVTGDSTSYQLVLDSTTTNIGSNYNASIGVFTAPVTGTYYFFCIMYFEGLNLSHTLLASNFISNSENIVMYYGNPTSNITSGEFAVNSSALIRMTAGDTCYAHTAVTGSTKTVTIAGGQGNTQFGGYLVC